MAKKKTTRKKRTSKKKTISKKKPVNMEIEFCPFRECGGKASLIENPWGKYVECKSCGANGPQHDKATSDKIVIGSWNKR